MKSRWNRLKLGVAVAAVALVCSASYADAFVLSHVRIVSPGKPTVENGMIIVSGNKIVHAGAPTSFEVGFTEIDCTGMTAYPGFIDAYSRTNLNLPSAPANAEAPNAVEGPLSSMWHENRKGVFADLDVASSIDSKSFSSHYNQGVTTALLASGRGAFGGLTAIVEMADGEKATVLRPHAFQEISFNTSGGGYPGSAMARIAFLRQLMYDGQYEIAHPGQDGESDALITAIGDVATGIQLALFAADSEREIQRALNLIDEFRLKVTLYGTSDVYQHAEGLKSRGINVIAQVGFPREPRVEQSEDAVRRLNDPPMEYLQEQHKTWEDNCLAVVKMQRSGVKFAFSSDGDTGAFLENVRKHVALGLPREAALRALTTDAADILGIGDVTGSLEVGKLANIVLMSGEFDKADSKIKHVFVEGKKIDMKEEN